MIDKWSYNLLTSKCEKFIYGGCGGNQNRFDTKEECMKTCVDIADENDHEGHDGHVYQEMSGRASIMKPLIVMEEDMKTENETDKKPGKFDRKIVTLILYFYLQMLPLHH